MAVVQDVYQKKTGITPEFYVCEAEDGATELEL